jgi:alpha-beta hydrolase superfamily lysophospholipase
MWKNYFVLLILSFGFGLSFSQKPVSFHAEDGLEITADLYEIDPTCPMVILCHQAGWSRGEYRQTALWLNANAFNCLAVDQRSGKGVNGVPNATAARAKKQGKGQAYLDAEQDIVAAVSWAAAHTTKDIILVGSSYSASLVLKVAHDMAPVAGVAAFSPGEYFGAQLKLGKTIDGLAKPTFITASQAEMPEALELAAHVQPASLRTYTPATAGHHGSRALWTSNSGYEGYREAFLNWLLQFKQ